MKIVFLSDDFPPMSFGGAGISTYELALGMKKAGHDVTVITTCRRKNDAGEINYNGLRVFKIATSYPSFLRAYISICNIPVVLKVRTLLKNIAPDIVHANNVHFYLSYHCLNVAKQYARAVILTTRDTMSICYGKISTPRYLEYFDSHLTMLDHLQQAKKRYNPFRNFLIKSYFKNVDKIFAISKSLQQALVRNGINSVEVIYNGIDTENWSTEENTTSHFKRKYGLEHNKILFFNGRLSDAKGGLGIIKALAKIVIEVPDVLLLIAGSVDEYAQKMKDEARKYNIVKHIVFTNWIEREEIKVAYAVSDIVLMLSTYLDPFGRVNIEAMVAKKPVVGTRYGGTPEIVEDGVTGYIVDPRNPEEIANKTIELLKNPEKAKQFGEAGYKRVKEKFNLEDKVKEYIVVYESLCKK